MGRRSGGSPGNKGFESEVATLPGVPAEEGRDFMAIAADSHGTPAATMRAGAGGALAALESGSLRTSRDGEVRLTGP